MIDRRTFLAASAAAALTPRPARAAARDMRVIPSTGVAIPAVGLGTWITFNVGNDPVLLMQSTEVMRAFFDEGGGVIDSSPMYGSAQKTLGHGLDKLARPGALFSADKIWTNSPADGLPQMTETATNWGVDHFDLMQVHNLLAVDEHLALLYQLKEQGRVKHVGVTTSHGRRHGELERVMRQYPLDFVQLTYNVLDREVEDRLLPLAQDRGIAVIVNRPFRRGGLINRTDGEDVPGFAAELGAKTWADLMLKFVLSHPAVTVAIPATTQPAHVKENKAAVRSEMPDAAMRERIAAEVARL